MPIVAYAIGRLNDLVRGEINYGPVPSKPFGKENRCPLGSLPIARPHGMTKADLERIRDLTMQRLSTGNEPPWVWYQLMKLREASESLIAGMDATQPTEGLQGLAPRLGGGLRLVDSNYPQETVQHRPGSWPVRLPT